jgi:DNA replication protein DnaC
MGLETISDIVARARKNASSGPVDQSEFEGHEAAEARHRADIHVRRVTGFRERSGVPARFETAAIADLTIDRGNETAIHSAAKIIADGCRDSAAFFGTGVGAGKTSIAAAIVNGALEQLIPAKMLTVVTLVDRMHEASKYGSAEDVTEIVQEFASAPVLLLDDLGREPVTRRSLSWLYELLNRRWNAVLPLLVTTNLSFEDLLFRYIDACKRADEPQSTAEAIVDRLRGMIPLPQWYEVRGKSRRGAA